MLNSDWPIKTHNPRSKILENRQINIAKTNFRAFQQYSARQPTSNYHSESNYFPRTTEEVHRNKMAQVKLESKEILLTFQSRII